MDLNEIWQEHKRFIITVVAGVLIFMIGNSVVASLYDGDISAEKGKMSRSASRLKGNLYTASDRALAESENDLLRASYDEMVAAVAFKPRPGFTGDSAATIKFAYGNAVEGVTDRLQDLASRNRALLVEGLGLETLTTPNVDEIERHLHALDMLERSVALALQAGVRRIRRIEIDLDPAFATRRGLGAIERTKVSIDAVSTAEAATRWLALAETPIASTGEGTAGELIRSQPLPIGELDMTRVSAKDDEVRTNVTFLVVRVHETEADAEDDE